MYVDSVDFYEHHDHHYQEYAHHCQEYDHHDDDYQEYDHDDDDTSQAGSSAGQCPVPRLPQGLLSLSTLPGCIPGFILWKIISFITL